MRVSVGVSRNINFLMGIGDTLRDGSSRTRFSMVFFFFLFRFFLLVLAVALVAVVLSLLLLAAPSVTTWLFFLDEASGDRRAGDRERVGDAGSFVVLGEDSFRSLAGDLREGDLRVGDLRVGDLRVGDLRVGDRPDEPSSIDDDDAANGLPVVVARGDLPRERERERARSSLPAAVGTDRESCTPAPSAAFPTRRDLLLGELEVSRGLAVVGIAVDGERAIVRGSGR